MTWLLSTEYPGNRESMNIYLGETRLATRLAYEHDETTAYEQINTYYYHGDHLGSANIVSDFEGGKYEHLEYTPYGELWVEDTDAAYHTPFRFTSKEWDEETRLYYMSARYMDPRTSRWVSADPAGFELVNPMEQDENGKLVAKQSYSLIESTNHYSYCSNNPTNYDDPTGMTINFFTGAIAGAVVSGAINLAVQLKSNGGDLSRINGKQLATAMAGGAIAGALTSGASAVASLTMGGAQVALMTAGGAVAGAAGSGVTTVLNNAVEGKNLTTNLKQNMIAGAVAGGAVASISSAITVSTTGGVGLLPPSTPTTKVPITIISGTVAAGKEIISGAAETIIYDNVEEIIKTKREVKIGSE